MITAAVLIAVAAFSASTGRADPTTRSSAFPITIHVSKRSIFVYPGSLTVTGHVGDTGHQGISVSVEASSDGGPWQYVGGSAFLARSGNVSVQSSIDRNTLFRLHVTTIDNNPSELNAYSRTVRVYVFPLISLSLTRTSANIVEVSYWAEVHSVRHAPRRRLFIYTRHPGARLFHLVASRWLRFSAQSTEYSLLYRLHDSRTVTVLVCTRVPLLPDMGKPFFNPGCGRPSGVA